MAVGRGTVGQDRARRAEGLEQFVEQEESVADFETFERGKCGCGDSVVKIVANY